jgi:nicotinamidase-related amidase
VVIRRRFSLDIPGTLEDACDPATMAVIVYDMQAGVVRQLPDGGAETMERVSRVLAAARAGGYPVFFTRHMSLPARLMGVAQRRTAMAWQHVDDPEIGIGPTVWHAVDLGFIPVVVTDSCGGRDRPAMQRVLDDIRFAGAALLTDTATITPLLSGPSTR